MKKSALMFIVLMTMPTVLRADAGVHYTDIALSGAGKPIANAPVRVCWEPVTATNPCSPVATVYSDITLTTVKPNPFTADALGNIDFYYDSSSGMKVTIEVSCQPGIPGCGPQGAVNVMRNVCIFCGETMQVDGTTVATQPIFNFITGPNVSLLGADDPTSFRANLTIAAANIEGSLNHPLLSDTHPDTISYTPPEFGDLVRACPFQSWSRFPVAQERWLLNVISVGGILCPDWIAPTDIDFTNGGTDTNPTTCTSVQKNGTEVGCEHEINFIEGDNITLTVTDSPNDNRVDVEIDGCASCGGAATTPDKVDTLVVDCNNWDFQAFGMPNTPITSWSTQTFATEPLTGASHCFVNQTTGAGFVDDFTELKQGLNEFVSDTAPTWKCSVYGRFNDVVNVRLWAGCVAVLAVALGTDDDPAPDTKDMMIFRFSDGTGGGPDPGAGDTHWMAALEVDSAATGTYIDTGVTPDTDWHLWETSYSAANALVTWEIDHVVVATHAATFTDAQGINPYMSVTALDTDDNGFDFGMFQITSTFQLGP